MKIRTRFAIFTIISAIVAVSAVVCAFEWYIIPKQSAFYIQNAYSILLHVRRIAPLISPSDLQPILESMSVENDSISYIFVFDQNEHVIAHSDRWHVGSTCAGYMKLFRNMKSDHIIRYKRWTLGDGRFKQTESVYEMVLPTVGKMGVYDGGVSIGVSIGFLQALRQEYYEAMTVVLALLFVVLLLANYILYNSIINPILELSKLIKDRGFITPMEFPERKQNDEIDALVKVLRSANVGVSDTISELHRREDELNEYTNSLPDIHAKLSPDGTIIMVNRAFLAVGDIPPGLVIGQKFWEAPWCALTMDARIKIQDVVLRIGSGGKAESVEVESLGLSENRLLDLAFKPVLDDDEKVKYIIVDGRDITERKMQEMENLWKYLEEKKRKDLDEVGKQDHYRNTVYAATDGKLRMVDHNVISSMIDNVIAGFSLEREDLLSDIRRDISTVCLNAGMSEESAAEMLSAVGEAMTNAIKHAGGGDVSVGVRDGVVWACVDDYGQGIDSLILPAILLRPGNSKSSASGYGFSLMLADVDLIYLASDQNGTTVLLEKSINGVALSKSGEG